MMPDRDGFKWDGWLIRRRSWADVGCRSCSGAGWLGVYTAGVGFGRVLHSM